MRRTALLISLAASVAAFATPAAQASTARPMVARATCDQGAQATLTSTVSPSGTEHARVTVSGVLSSVWHGSLQLDPENAPVDADGMPIIHNGRYVARHHAFTVAATQPDARTHDAQAFFHTASFDLCAVRLVADRGIFGASDGGGDGVAVRTTVRPSVVGFLHGEAHHRYRFDFTLRTPAGTRHWSRTRIAGSLGSVQATVPVKGLSSFSDVAVRVIDTNLVAPVPQSFEFQR